MPRTATRRQLLRNALAASAISSAAVQPAAAAPTTASPQSESAALSRALSVERLVVVAYRDVLSSGLTTAGVSRQLGRLLAQEHEHVAAVERALRTLGAAIPPPPASPAAAQSALARHNVNLRLGRLRTQHECLRLLIDVESLAEGAYFAAISKLSDPNLVRMSVEIMGCEAQHWTVLSDLQRPGDVGRAVPYPFVQGST
jgi:ferritin-like protein